MESFFQLNWKLSNFNSHIPTSDLLSNLGSIFFSFILIISFQTFSFFPTALSNFMCPVQVNFRNSSEKRLLETIWYQENRVLGLVYIARNHRLPNGSWKTECIIKFKLSLNCNRCLTITSGLNIFCTFV